MNITSASHIGPRDDNEDRYVQFTDDNGAVLLGVFDGHSGSKTVQLIRDYVVDFYHSYKHFPPEEMLQHVFRAFDLITSTEPSGTTASLVYIPKPHNKAYVAVLGDSPVIIFDKNGDFNYSPEHNIRTNPAELEAARKRGAIQFMGYIFDAASIPVGPYSSGYPTGNGLQLTRALGDLPLRNVLSQEPDIYSVELSEEHSYVLLASDGLIDPAHGESKKRLRDLEYMVAYGSGANELVQFVIKGEPRDNVTAILAKMWEVEEKETEAQAEVLEEMAA